MSLVSLIVNEVVAWCMLAREQTSKMLKDATVSLLNFRHLRTFLSFHVVPLCAQLCTYNSANFAEAPAAAPCNGHRAYTKLQMSSICLGIADRL